MTQTLLQRHNDLLCMATLLRQAGIPADECPGLKEHPYGSHHGQVFACKSRLFVNHIGFRFAYNSQNDNRKHEFSFIELTAKTASLRSEVRRTLLKQRTISGVTLSYANLKGLKQRYDELLPIALQGAKAVAERDALRKALVEEGERKRKACDSILTKLGIEPTMGSTLVRTANYGDTPDQIAWQVTLRVDSPEALEAVLQAHKDHKGLPSDDRAQAAPRGGVRMPKPWKGDV